MNKKGYATPDFELVKLQFESLMQQKMLDSNPEDDGSHFEDDWG